MPIRTLGIPYLNLPHALQGVGKTGRQRHQVITPELLLLLGFCNQPFQYTGLTYIKGLKLKYPS